MRGSTDHSPVTFHRPQALRTVVSMYRRAAHTPALFLVLAGSLMSAFAGMFGVAAWSSLGPEPDDYLTEYEAASLTALVGIQKLAIFAGVGLFVLAAAVCFIGALVITQMSDTRP